MQIKLFQQLRDAGDTGVSSTAICKKSGIKSQQQLDRILRHLAATGVLGIKQAGVWLYTPLSNELATDHFQHSILFCHHVTRHVFDGFPEYFNSLAKDDGDPAAVPGPFQLSMKTDLPFFDYLSANPPFDTYFNYFMRAYRAGNAMWYESYPVTSRLVEGFDSAASEDVFLVDVGGGKGHDLAAFAAAEQQHPGKLILQDQPSVIAQITPSAEGHAFEPQTHDFFTPQPIRHARAYYLHSILHDWGDADCARILAALKPALKPGYSKVLFNEIVLSEERPSVAATNMDIMMLGHLNPAHERTESAWRQLIESAGYKVVDIVRVAGAAESVIEAEIA